MLSPQSVLLAVECSVVAELCVSPTNWSSSTELSPHQKQTAQVAEGIQLFARTVLTLRKQSAGVCSAVLTGQHLPALEPNGMTNPA